MRGPLTSLTRALSLSLPAVRLLPRRSPAQFGRRRRVAAPEVISPSPSCPAVSLATDAVSSLLSVEGLWVSHRLQTRLAGTLDPLGGESRLRTLRRQTNRQAGRGIRGGETLGQAGETRQGDAKAATRGYRRCQGAAGQTGPVQTHGRTDGHACGRPG